MPSVRHGRVVHEAEKMNEPDKVVGGHDDTLQDSDESVYRRRGVPRAAWMIKDV